MTSRVSLMYRGAVTVVLTAAMACLAGGSAMAGSDAPAMPLGGQGWGTAEEVPGTAALNTDGSAGVTSVSCASAGNCSTVGDYDSSHGGEPFVVNRADGAWGTAVEVPGVAALDNDTYAGITSVSCASAGNCTAGGDYHTHGFGHHLHTNHTQVFVVSQVNGAWGTAVEVPGIAALNTDRYAGVTSVSCASAGNCTAGGYYYVRSASGGYGYEEPFVVSQVDGAWGTAIEVPGIKALNTGRYARINSVSCGSAGNCTAGGYYSDSSSPEFVRSFVVSEVDGAWGTAIEVPGTAALNTGDGGLWVGVSSVSCASAGNCSAAGLYSVAGSGYVQSFVVSEVNGAWGTAIEAPGTKALNTGGIAYIESVSCGSAGNCTAGGNYEVATGHHAQAFVISQVNGTWGTAIKMPGSTALSLTYAGITSVSCASAGNCTAVGGYTNSGHGQAFVDSQVNGTWDTAIEVPGTAALNQGGDADISSVSCAPAGNCSAGGDYTDASGHRQAFVVSKT
jgi:hypothetical protein